MRYYKLERRAPGQMNWIVIDELSTRNPNALHIEADIAEYTNGITSNSIISIYNIEPRFLSEYGLLEGNEIRLIAGFDSALPLAKREQIGVIAQGKVTNSLTFIDNSESVLLLKVFPSGEDLGLDIKVEVKSGQLVRTIINRFMVEAKLPRFTVTENVKKLESDKSATFIVSKFLDFKNFLFRTYGIKTVYTAGQYTFILNETIKTKKLDYTDLVGQPIGETDAVVNFRVNLRGDISIGDEIISNITRGDARAPFNDNAVSDGGVLFSGRYEVFEINHTIRSRDASQNSYTTSLKCGRINGL